VDWFNGNATQNGTAAMIVRLCQRNDFKRIGGRFSKWKRLSIRTRLPLGMSPQFANACASNNLATNNR
jgi:hypothetical protein